MVVALADGSWAKNVIVLMTTESAPVLDISHTVASCASSRPEAALRHDWDTILKQVLCLRRQPWAVWPPTVSSADHLGLEALYQVEVATENAVPHLRSGPTEL